MFSFVLGNILCQGLFVCFLFFQWMPCSCWKTWGNFVKIHKHIDGHFIIGKIDINVSISQTVKYPLSDYLHIPTHVLDTEIEFLQDCHSYLSFHLNFNQSTIYRLILLLSIFDIYDYFLPLWYPKYQIIIMSLLARFGSIRTCNHIMYRV